MSCITMGLQHRTWSWNCTKHECRNAVWMQMHFEVSRLTQSHLEPRKNKKVILILDPLIVSNARAFQSRYVCNPLACCHMCQKSPMTLTTWLRWRMHAFAWKSGRWSWSWWPWVAVWSGKTLNTSGRACPWWRLASLVMSWVPQGQVLGRPNFLYKRCLRSHRAGRHNEQ